MKHLLALLVFIGLITGAQAQSVFFSSVPNTLVNGSLTSGPLIMGDFDRIVSDGNTAYTNFLAEIAAISGAPTPSGAVVPFNLSACPTGWKASDGTAGTVDLRGKFIRATTGSPAVGTVQADQLLNHTHAVLGSFIGGLTFGSVATFTGGGVSFTSGEALLTVGNAVSGNSGSETRPKNVALLMCQKS